MRLIDKDELLEKIEEISRYDDFDVLVVDWDDMIICIDNAPTIEAEPIKHGKWIKDGNTSRCSECGYAPISKIFFRGEKIWEISLIDKYHWCPYCGTKMAGGE